MSTSTKFKDAQMRRIFLSSRGSFHVVKADGKKKYAPKARYVNNPGGTTTRSVHRSEAHVPSPIRLKRPGPAKRAARSPSYRAGLMRMFRSPKPRAPRRVFFGPRRQRKDAGKKRGPRKVMTIADLLRG